MVRSSCLSTRGTKEKTQKDDLAAVKILTCSKSMELFLLSADKYLLVFSCAQVLIFKEGNAKIPAVCSGE